MNRTNKTFYSTSCVYSYIEHICIAFVSIYTTSFSHICALYLAHPTALTQTVYLNIIQSNSVVDVVYIFFQLNEILVMLKLIRSFSLYYFRADMYLTNHPLFYRVTLCYICIYIYTCIYIRRGDGYILYKYIKGFCTI